MISILSNKINVKIVVALLTLVFSIQFLSAKVTQKHAKVYQEQLEHA